jgi:signal transduction histidine kinase
VFQILARQIAIAIRNADLFEEAHKANAAKTNFISYIGHEVRNPVNSILHATETMLKFPEIYGEARLPEEFHADIVDIDQDGRYLKKLIDDVLDLAKIEAGKIDLAIKAIDPVPILKEAKRYAAGMVQAGVELRASYPDRLPDILADDLRLKQILMNLVGNAVKFTEQGSITLDA